MTTFVSLLISFNYLVLYAVIIVPFVLISLQDEVESVVLNGEKVACELNQAACDTLEDENRVSFNNSVLMVNLVVLVYFLICELLVVCCNLRPTNTKCNSFLCCQMITGLTSRAVVLISAQLIAVFVQDINLVNIVLGIIISSTLVLSQLRVVQIWLSSIKKDQNKLLPKVKQNFNICMSTNYLAAATLYGKVNVDGLQPAIHQQEALLAEKAQLMSFSFADDDSSKGAKKKTNVKAKLAKTCKCCRWTSPKFYQLIMNDIPLVICLPFAFFFGLMDSVNAAVGIALTMLDLLFMVFYLNYDEELSINAKQVYDLTEARMKHRESANERIFNDEISLEIISESDSQRSQRQINQN